MTTDFTLPIDMWRADENAEDNRSIGSDDAVRDLALRSVEETPRRGLTTAWLAHDLERFELSDPRKWGVRTANEPEDSVHFAHCVLNEGDTLVFIDVPNSTTDPRRRTNCDGVVPASQSFWVHSERLFALTDSKFPQMLDNEIYQARVRRRRKPTEEQMKGAKYLLDLTPPFEGDELVFQMTELSLTPGIVKWWNADKLHAISKHLVKGHDDICTCRQDAAKEKEKDIEMKDTQTQSNPATGEAPPAAPLPLEQENDPEPISLPPTVDTLLRMRAKNENILFKTPPHYQIPDYCPFRHCYSIVRLLMMIEGKGVNLNSAARVWTMVGISKIFECPSVVRDQVAQWILYNQAFIEVLPEETLNMGFALELPQITQSAFRILVNELALAQESDKDIYGRRRKFSVFGRRLGDPGDERSNLIQHAARALIERVNSQLDQIRDHEVYDTWGLAQWKKLRRIEKLLETEDDGTFTIARSRLSRLMSALSEVVWLQVERTISENMPGRYSYPEMDKDRATYVEPKHFEKLQFIIPTFNLTQKLLCPFFYHELGTKCSSNLFYGQRSAHPDSRNEYLFRLVCDLEIELQWLVDRDPTRGYRDSWQPIFPSSSTQESDSTESRKVQAPLIDLDLLDAEVKRHLRPFTRSWEREDKGLVPQPNITRHMLLTLTNNEMKFLPLWAGGNDDGTGGVFESFLPPAEMGPNGPGPAFHTGMTIPSAPASLSGSLMEDISAMKIMGSTTAGSVDVHDSVSTVYHPDKVIAADTSIKSESFGGNDSEYEQAKFAVPAENQAMGQALETLVDSADQDSDDTLSDATEIANLSDDDLDSNFQEDDRQSSAKSDTSSMVLV